MWNGNSLFHQSCIFTSQRGGKKSDLLEATFFEKKCSGGKIESLPDRADEKNQNTIQCIS